MSLGLLKKRRAKTVAQILLHSRQRRYFHKTILDRILFKRLDTNDTSSGLSTVLLPRLRLRLDCPTCKRPCMTPPCHTLSPMSFADIFGWRVQLLWTVGRPIDTLNGACRLWRHM